MGICEYEPDVLFVHQGDGFFGLAEFCVGECSEDIEAGVFFALVFMLSVCGENLIFFNMSYCRCV